MSAEAPACRYAWSRSTVGAEQHASSFAAPSSSGGESAVTCSAAWSGPGNSRIAKSGRAESASIRSEEHTSELQSLMRISYAVFCLKKKKTEHGTHALTCNKYITHT